MKKFSAVVILFVCFGAMALPGAASSLQDRNKAVAMRVFDEIFNQGKFQVAGEIYAPDFVNHGLHKNFGLQEDQAAVHWEKTAMPDLTITVDKLMAEDDQVAVVWTLHGTNTARAGWVPATGAKIEVRGITVWRIVDGKICEEWTTFDEIHIARQIVTQLMWPLLGLLCAVAIVAWMASKPIRRLRRVHTA